MRRDDMVERIKAYGFRNEFQIEFLAELLERIEELEWKLDLLTLRLNVDLNTAYPLVAEDV